MKMSATAYHTSTSYDRHAMTPHIMDWPHQPAQAKTYDGLESLSLPQPMPLTGRLTRDVLLTASLKETRSDPVGLEDVARVLRLCTTPTAVLRHAGEDHFLRSVPSAGALYPTEVYLACRRVQGLEDGLYHYPSLEHRLLRLRAEDPSPAIHRLLACPDDRPPTLCFFLSAIFFRSAWKYRSRSYRYHCLDTGHLLESLCLALAALELPAVVHFDFDDDRANRFLGLNVAREVTLAVVPVSARREGEGGESIDRLDSPPLPAGILKASRTSAREVDYPEVRAVHEAGKALKAHPRRDEVLPVIERLGPETEAWAPLAPAGPWDANPPYPDCLFSRRSRRNFDRTPMTMTSLNALVESLKAAAQPHETIPADSNAVLGTGLLISRVQGVPSGMLLLDLEKGRAGRVGSEDLTASMARICLDQAWLAGAALHVLFMADLEALDLAWGARGYRYAMLWAGRLAQRTYLAATALGQGCCGIGAFYDGEAAEALGLQGASRLLYLVAVGPIRGGLR